MEHNIWAVPLQLSNFNIIVAVLGGFISLFGLVSYLLKENYYLSEAREFPSPRGGFRSAGCRVRRRSLVLTRHGIYGWM